MIWAIKSPDPSEYPDKFAELAVAVQLKVVPITDEERRISVVSPEQIEGVLEVMIRSGMG